MMKKNDNNDVFCIAPWTHLSSWTTNEVYPCCTSFPYSYGSLNENTLQQLWNSDKIKQLRLNMLNGIRSDACSECYLSESMNKTSSRQMINEKLQHHFQYVPETKDDGTFERFNFIFWDLRLSNVCNFKCRSCGPDYSTSWYDESNEHSDLYQGDEHYTQPKRITSNILKQLEPLYETVEAVYFSGGEPLLSEEHYHILNELNDHKKHDIVLMYNTNLSVLPHHILNLWKNFNQLDIHVSVEGYKEKGELIRKGFDWNVFVENVKQFKRELPHVRLYVDCLFQVLNSFHITELHQKLYEENIISHVDDFIVNFLVTPEYLSVEILDEVTKKQVCDNLQNHIQSFVIPHGGDVTSFKNCISYVQSGSKQSLISKFKRYTNALDMLRNEDVIQMFPELIKLYE